MGKLRVTELFRMSTENSSGASSIKFNRAGKSMAYDLKLAGIVYLLDVIGIELSSTSSNKDCAFKLEKAIKKNEVKNKHLTLVKTYCISCYFFFKMVIFNRT